MSGWLDTNLHVPSPSCQIFNIPQGGSTSTPRQLNPGILGVTLRGGEIMNSPTELGFAEGIVCDNGAGSCPSYGDVGMCQAKLEYECGTGHTGPGIMSDCGTHANPIHMHEVCVRCAGAPRRADT